MNRNDVELLLAAEYARLNQQDFVISVSPAAVFSLATSLRHLVAAGVIDSYSILDEASGTVQIIGYVAQP